jgi:hypothetical protein
MKDFFISYTKDDKDWATRLDNWLQEQGYTTIVQANDFLAGGNFMSNMHQGIDAAERMVLVLSPSCLTAKFPEAEWTAKLATDPTGERHTVIPVRIQECEPGGLLRPIPYIDLVGLEVKAARAKFLNEISAAMAGGPKPPRRSSGKARPARAKAPAPPQGGVTQNNRVTNNLGIIAQNVTVQSPRQRKPKPKYPEGSVGANLYMYAYLEYLVDRYNDWRVDGQKHYGDNRPFAYPVIHQNVKQRFGIRTYHAPQARFEDLVRFLQGKIDQTIKGQHNSRKRIRNYHTFGEHKAKVDGNENPPTPPGPSEPKRSLTGALASALGKGITAARAKAEAINCINNLKQVGTAARLWAEAHGGVFPPDLASIGPALGSARLTHCPLHSSLSYEVLSPGATESEPAVVFARCPIHNNVVLADGSAQQLGGRQLVCRKGKWTIAPGPSDDAK